MQGASPRPHWREIRDKKRWEANDERALIKRVGVTQSRVPRLFALYYILKKLSIIGKT
jgi:hypothetical protein